MFYIESKMFMNYIYKNYVMSQFVDWYKVYENQ